MHITNNSDNISKIKKHKIPVFKKKKEKKTMNKYNK